jgi:DHA2 family multidrug resistance protein
MTSAQIMLSGFIQGIGIGLLFAPLSTLAYATLQPEHRVEGAIISNMIRSLGSSVRISVVSAIVIRNTAMAHNAMASGIDPSSPSLRLALPAAMDPTTATGLQALNAEVTRQAGMIGYVGVFNWMTLFVVLLIPLLLLLRPSARGAVTSPTEAHVE